MQIAFKLCEIFKFIFSNGVNSPSLAFSSIPQIQDFKIILKNVIPAYIKLNFHFEGDVQSCKEFLNNYHSYLQSQQVEPESLEGGFYFNLQEAEDQSKLLLHSKSLFPKYRCLNITATKDNDHPNISSYLGELIKSIDQTFQLIEEADISNIQITVQIGKSYFVEIAKIRAIRILWKHLCNAYQVSERIAYINAIFEEEAYDEDTNTNMIRSMTMAMSAVIGGVNRLTIRPADQSDSTMTNRIARNVQHLLKMESYMDRVIDPAAGSYYIEKLTNLFVEQAWEVLLQSKKKDPAGKGVVR